MTASLLQAEALALSISDPVSLAQALWEGIDWGLPEVDANAAMREAFVETARCQQESPAAVLMSRS